MSIIVNGTSIPANGDYIVVNGVKAEKVIVNGSTVWEKQVSVPVTLTEGIYAPWDSRVQFTTIRANCPIDFSDATINMEEEWDEEGFGNDFVFDMTFPTLGNKTLYLTVFQGGVEIYLDEKWKYTFSGSPNDTWGNAYDISGGSTVRLRCTAEDRWGQSGCVQFGRTRIY